MEIYLAIMAGLGGMFGWGLADFFAKKTVDKIGGFKTLLWMQTFSIIPTAIYLLFNWGPANLEPKIILMLFLLSIADLAAYFLFYRGLQKGLVSVLSPIFAAQSGVSVLVSAFIFGEAITSMHWLALAIAFTGIILVSFQRQESNKNFSWGTVTKGLPEVLAGMVIFGFFFPAWDWFLGYQGEGWIASLFLGRVFNIIILVGAAYLVSSVKKQKANLEVKKSKIWIWLALIGIFDTTAALFAAWGYRFTSMTSVVVVLSGAFVVPTVILARIFLKEKLTLNQIVGVAAIIAGLIILAI